MKKLLLSLVLAIGAQAATIVTSLDGSNSFAGNMFDVRNVATDPVEILGTFRVNLSASTGAQVSVYYKLGTYVGSETTPGDWTLLGAATGVSGAGVNIPTAIDVGNSFLIGPAETYGLYVTVTNYPTATMYYSNGSDVIDDGVLELSLGNGRCNPDFTGSIFSPRIWNGEIDYEVISSEIPEPSSWLLLGTGLAAFAFIRRRK